MKPLRFQTSRVRLRVSHCASFFLFPLAVRAEAETIGRTSMFSALLISVTRILLHDDFLIWLAPLRSFKNSSHIIPCAKSKSAPLYRIPKTKLFFGAFLTFRDCRRFFNNRFQHDFALCYGHIENPRHRTARWAFIKSIIPTVLCDAALQKHGSI
jgi:hypothetical protein